MPIMVDDEEQELAALRKLLQSGPRTNRARPMTKREMNAPALPENDHVEKTTKLMELLQTGEGLEEAEKVMRQELQTREADYGFGHENTLISASRLALLLQAKGKTDDSLHLHNRTVEGYEMLDSHGPNHPDTLTAVNNLAVLLKRLGKYDKALPLYQRVLAADEAKQGKSHPHTLDSVYNLARLYEALGQVEKAVPLYRRELEGCVQHYGKEHNETHTSAENLAKVLVNTGDEAAAEALNKEFGLK